MTVTGLTVGTEYNLSFFQAISSYPDSSVADSYTSGNWRILFDGNEEFASDIMEPTGISGQSYPWELQSFNFVATATEFVLRIQAAVDWEQPPAGQSYSNQKAYLGIDGLRIATIPEPSRVLLSLLGLLLVFSKRSRN